MNARPKITLHSHNADSAAKKRSGRRTKGRATDDATDILFKDTVRYEIVAIRDINKGSEILMSYGNDYWSHRPNILPVQCPKHQCIDMSELEQTKSDSSSGHDTLNNSDFEMSSEDGDSNSSL